MSEGTAEVCLGSTWCLCCAFLFFGQDMYDKYNKPYVQERIRQREAQFRPVEDEGQCGPGDAPGVDFVGPHYDYWRY